MENKKDGAISQLIEAAHVINEEMPAENNRESKRCGAITRNGV